MKNDERNTIRILCMLGVIPVVWLALLIAPFVSGGLAEIVTQFPVAMERPFHIVLCQDSQKTVLIFLLIYGLGIGVALSSRRNYRRGEEHGSAKWGSASVVNRKYRAKDPEANKVFTKHVRMGLDGRKHRRNLNTVVVGGSGSGKSRFYALINLLQGCTSYFVLDCKGELLRMTGTFLKLRGYEIKVLDSPESIILESVLEGMSEYYSKNLAREVMKEMRESAMDWRYIGSWIPYGFRVDPQTRRYIINEYEAEAGRMIFRDVADGCGYNVVLNKLNALGYCTRVGNTFEESPKTLVLYHWHDYRLNQKSRVSGATARRYAQGRISRRPTALSCCRCVCVRCSKKSG